MSLSTQYFCCCILGCSVLVEHNREGCGSLLCLPIQKHESVDYSIYLFIYLFTLRLIGKKVAKQKTVKM